MKNKPTLPQRMWYSLEQAAHKLTKETGEIVTIQDLIYFWGDNKLNLYTTISYSLTNFELAEEHIKDEILDKFDFDHELINLACDNYLPEETLQDFVCKNLFYFLHPNGAISSFIYHMSGTKQIEKYPIIQNNRLFFSIEGLISFSKDKLFINEKHIIKNNKFTFTYKQISLKSPKDVKGERIYLKLDLKENISISLDNVYILHSELMDFINGNYDTGNIERDFSQIQKNSSKTQNTQARFIRDLLKLYYGLKTASDVRVALDDPNSDLRKDMEKREMTAPSGKTIYKYLNQIED
ncbi:hypothetical protein NMW79_03300 [Pasteurella multocida]|uniref:hypothetical protein n=1 Tax=Pasteurella multocida TaxID=747 RepID=UPI0023011812|nr:hypothetical protein [Pasteurella multocida]MDA5621521.1 hypothetical protein [Pasteurella multocida subsp. multocida]MDH3001780.1 hypothetical protein [Pasteurella multocida]MDY0685304.1 hypothetical protein [Pasteurella multocida]